MHNQITKQTRTDMDNIDELTIAEIQELIDYDTYDNKRN